MFVSIAICVILPIMIVWLVQRTVTNRDNKNAEIILKAIENNSTIDADALVNALGRRKVSSREILNKRLLRGCMFSLIGVALVISDVVMYCTSTDPDGNDMLTLFMIFSGVLLAIGIAYLIVYYVTRREVDTSAGENEQKLL